MVDDHRDARDAARREVRRRRKGIDARGVQDAAENVIEQVVTERLEAVLFIVPDNALFLFHTRSPSGNHHILFRFCIIFFYYYVSGTFL